jgi:hypothetical protein
MLVGGAAFLKSIRDLSYHEFQKDAQCHPLRQFGVSVRVSTGGLLDKLDAFL